MTALDYYQVTTQMQRDYFESIGLKRTKQVEIEGSIFRYSKIKPDLFFGFTRRDAFFIATPEKAFLDMIYLYTLGRYVFDMASIDFRKLEENQLRELAVKFPLKTRNYLEKHEYFSTT